MLSFAGREKCKGCHSGSGEQMSYSSRSSSIRLSFPISSHNWQARFTSWGRGRGSEIWCQVNRHYYSINSSHADKKLPWIFDGSVFPECLWSLALLCFHWPGASPLHPCVSLWKMTTSKPQRHLGFFALAAPAGGMLLLAICACSTLIQCLPSS